MNVISIVSTHTNYECITVQTDHEHVFGVGRKPIIIVDTPNVLVNLVSRVLVCFDIAESSLKLPLE